MELKDNGVLVVRLGSQAGLGIVLKKRGARVQWSTPSPEAELRDNSPLADHGITVKLRRRDEFSEDRH